MANNPTPSAAARDFTLDDAVRLMHQAVYGSGDQPPLRITKSDYHVVCDHLETLYSAASALERAACGMELLSALLSTGGEMAGWQQAHIAGINGLLRPLERELAHHAQALNRAAGRHG